MIWKGTWMLQRSGSIQFPKKDQNASAVMSFILNITFTSTKLSREEKSFTTGKNFKNCPKKKCLWEVLGRTILGE